MLDYDARPGAARRWWRWAVVGVLVLAGIAVTPAAVRRADDWLLRRRVATWQAREARVAAITGEIPRMYTNAPPPEPRTADELRALWLRLADALDGPLRERAAALGHDEWELTIHVDGVFSNVGGFDAGDLHWAYVDAGGIEPLPPLIRAAGRDAVLRPLLDDPSGREQEALVVGDLLAWAPPADAASLRRMAEAWRVAGPQTRAAYAAAAGAAMLDHPAEAAEVFRLAKDDSYPLDRADAAGPAIAAGNALRWRFVEPWSRATPPYHKVLVILFASGDRESGASSTGKTTLEWLLDAGVELPGPAVADAALERMAKERAGGVAHAGRLVVRPADVRPDQLRAARRLASTELDRLAAIPPERRSAWEIKSPAMLRELLASIDARLAGDTPDPRLAGGHIITPGEVRTPLGTLVGYDPAGLGVPAWVGSGE